ncbi:MAG TPA: hypothetical protein VEX62_07600 [Candidatus Limnocylindrales bacterium]|nr:hypothetical protein [Candidatus Limnocylindrales bacterium]
MRRLVILAAIVLACSGTPLPTGMPPPTDAPSPTAKQAVATTPIPASNETPSASPSRIDHPSGSDEIVLRMSVHESLPYPGTTFQRPPDFTLYGDGHAIYAYPTEIAGERVTGLRHAQLSDAQMDALLVYARNRLEPAMAEYDDVAVTDMEQTVFAINAGGIDKNVWAYALSTDDYTGPDPAGRRALAELSNKLGSFSSEVNAVGVEDLGEFEPAAYRASMIEPWWGEAEPVAEWPWAGRTIESFDRVENELVAIVTPSEAQVIVDIGIPDTLVTEAPNGMAYVIRLRPLLPDQLPEDWPSQ